MSNKSFEDDDTMQPTIFYLFNLTTCMLVTLIFIYFISFFSCLLDTFIKFFYAFFKYINLPSCCNFIYNHILIRLKS